MADIKINNNKYILGDDDFKITDGDLDTDDKYFSLSHNSTDSVMEVGSGSRVIKYEDPYNLPDDGYFDLPAGSAGYGVISSPIWGIFVKFMWSSDNTVTLIAHDAYTTDADTDNYFCIFDNTSSVRVKNRMDGTVNLVFSYSYITQPLAPTFRLFSGISGVDNLDPELTINGTTVTPTLRYKGGDATNSSWIPWGYGETLTAQSTGATLNAGSPCLGPNDDAVDPAESQYWQASSSSLADITTEDMVIELVFKTRNSSQVATNQRLISKIIGGSGGYRIYMSNSSSLVFSLYDGTDFTSFTHNTGLEDTWVHILIFVNRDEASTYGVNMFINGVLEKSSDFSAANVDISSTGEFTIGATVGGVVPWDTPIAYVCFWKQSSWHQAGIAGLAEWRNIAAERFAKFSGMFPQVHSNNSYNLISDVDMEDVGTAFWTGVDATLSKDTTAPLYSGTQHIRITSTGSTFYARPATSLLVIGRKYRTKGAARSVSGSAVPIIYETTGTQWTGTSSTDWQEFDIEFVASGVNIFYGSSSSSGVVDYDAVELYQIDGLPIVNTRAFEAYLDKPDPTGTIKLYSVGPEWLRLCHRQDSNGEDVYGYLPEKQITNLTGYSEDFESWTKNIAGDAVANNAVVCPDGRTAAASYISNSTPASHFFYTAVTFPSATTSFSVYAKPGNNDWINLTAASIGDCYFDIANGTVGTATDCTGYIEGPFYGGFYRCCIVFAGDGAFHGARIYTCSSGSSTVTTGNGSTVNMYLWHGQVESNDYMTSPVRTSGGSTATRLYDHLQFLAGNNIGGEDTTELTVVSDLLYSDYDLGLNKYPFDITDDESGNDKMLGSIMSTGDRSRIDIRESGNPTNYIYGPVVDMVDGVKHEIRWALKESSNIVYTDDVAGVEASTTFPDDKNILDIGSAGSATLALDGLMARFRIYASLITEE